MERFGHAARTADLRYLEPAPHRGGARPDPCRDRGRWRVLRRDPAGPAVSPPCLQCRRRELRMLFAVLGLAPVLSGWGAEVQPQVPQSALRACASIVADAERLACYDRLVAPAGANPAPAPAAATPPAVVAPSSAAPAAAPPAVVAAPSAAPAAAPPPTESFGMYAAEHPKPPVAVAAAALEAAVVALGTSPSGKMTVQFEGGALWELEEADPLLAVGDVVTINRAALGSYLMHTPTRRTHRVRRLR